MYKYVELMSIPEDKLHFAFLGFGKHLGDGVIEWAKNAVRSNRARH
jgi:hypothetical protein